VAAPSYTSDLSTFNLAENSGTVEELTGTTVLYNYGGTPVINDTDDIIQGSYHASAAAKQSAGQCASIAYDYGSGVTIPTDGAFLIWHKFDAGGLLDFYANGGVRVCVGSSVTAFKVWKIAGKDVTPFPYGGWKNYALNPTVSTDLTTEGSPTSTLQHVGMAIMLTGAGPSKGNPHKMDAIRYGRCEARMNGGDVSNGYATFAGFAAKNDANDATNGYNRWGLIQAVAGGFLWKGLMTLGYSSAVDFRDSNTNVFIDDTRKVTAGFNKIDIRQATSRIDWTNVNFICTNPSTTTSKGRLEVVDDADVNLSYCTFTDMDTFIFKSNSAVLNSTFRRCNTITANDADFSYTLFDAASVAADTSQLVWDVNSDPNNDLDNCTFIKGANAHHAIEFGTTSPTTMTLTNVIFSGFNASNAQNDSAIHIKRTTGTVTITITGGTSPSYKTAGAAVVIVTSSRTVKAIAQLADGTRIGLARVLLRTAATASGGFPYDATVTITNSSTTATVSHTAHGMATNDKIQITGASLSQNNGVFAITKISDDSYSYIMASAPGSNPTGTIKATFVFLEGETNNTEGATKGEISMSRAIGANQAVTGWARKASSNYKQGPLSGTVLTTGDLTLVAILSPDA
jgi:hypothetical protein